MNKHTHRSFASGLAVVASLCVVGVSSAGIAVAQTLGSDTLPRNSCVGALLAGEPDAQQVCAVAEQELRLPSPPARVLEARNGVMTSGPPCSPGTAPATGSADELRCAARDAAGQELRDALQLDTSDDSEGASSLAGCIFAAESHLQVNLELGADRWSVTYTVTCNGAGVTSCAAGYAAVGFTVPAGGMSSLFVGATCVVTVSAFYVPIEPVQVSTLAVSAHLHLVAPPALPVPQFQQTGLSSWTFPSR